jgi:YidC/Oxa1 family membrane protein insertase
MARHAAKMKRLQPKIDELKKKHADDPAKLRQAQAELMQKEGAFPPLGGCLPLFLQFPIFIGLFQALRVSFDLRHAPFFGWIEDLSHPDRLLEINLATGLPFIGTIQYLNILPPLMVVLWIAQQATMPKPADEQAAKMQRMMMFMPAVFGVFLYNYAAGLSLYMITGSLLGIIEQHVIKRMWPIDDSELERKPQGGFMARMMERAAAAQKEHEKRNRGKGGGGGKKR